MFSETVLWLEEQEPKIVEVYLLFRVSGETQSVNTVIMEPFRTLLVVRL